MASYDVEFQEMEELEKLMDTYEGAARKAINDVLHGEGGELIKNRIQSLIPASGRTWSKKKTAASAADALEQKNEEMLAVTVKSKTAYNYLYFPDDGSDTVRHAGGKEFFRQGAEESMDGVLDLCLGRLVDEF